MREDVEDKPPVAAVASAVPSSEAGSETTELKAEPLLNVVPTAEWSRPDAPSREAGEAPLADDSSSHTDAPIPPPVAASASASAAPSRRMPFGILAASLAVALALGAAGGAFSASSLVRPAPPVPETVPQKAVASDETRALQDKLVQLRSEFSALKSSVNSGAKNANGQFAKLSERFDRVERAQSEPAAKIAKAVEAIERIEKRHDVAKDVTGSVNASASSSASAASKDSGVVEGWFVRDVYRGGAVIQGRRFGIMEVEPGDTVPGVGRVEAIRKQDGRWVVVTSKGLITSMR